MISTSWVPLEMPRDMARYARVTCRVCKRSLVFAVAVELVQEGGSAAPRGAAALVVAQGVWRLLVR